MHIVFTMGDIFLLLFIALIVVYFSGAFLWTLIKEACKAIKSDWTGKR